jgi:Zinc finger, C3HC4 type (RING finger)
MVCNFVAAESGAMSTPVSASSGRGRPSADTGNCLICLDRSADTAMYQCGHMCLCYPCGMQIRQRGAHCPVCRAPVRDIIRIYRNA